MAPFAAWLNSPVGQVIRDIVEGGIAGAVAAVVALQLDVATPRVIAMALLAGFISAAIAVARQTRRSESAAADIDAAAMTAQLRCGRPYLVAAAVPG